MGTTMAARPLRLQDMLKTAMAESSRRVSVGLEAERQLGTPVEEEKTASVPAGVVNSEYALKLASAIEFIAADFDKQAEGVGTGPNHLEVTESNRTETFPAHQGEGHHTVPMHTGLQAASQSGGAKTQVPNDADRAPGGPGHQTTEYNIIKLDQLNGCQAGDIVSFDALLTKGSVNKSKHDIHKIVVGREEFTAKDITVQAHAFTKTARSAIEAAGGKCQLLKPTTGEVIEA